MQVLFFRTAEKRNNIRAGFRRHRLPRETSTGGPREKTQALNITTTIGKRVSRSWEHGYGGASARAATGEQRTVGGAGDRSGLASEHEMAELAVTGPNESRHVGPSGVQVRQSSEQMDTTEFDAATRSGVSAGAGGARAASFARPTAAPPSFNNEPPLIDLEPEPDPLFGDTDVGHPNLGYSQDTPGENTNIGQ